jgi:hypothetical protein
MTNWNKRSHIFIVFLGLSLAHTFNKSNSGAESTAEVINTIQTRLIPNDNSTNNRGYRASALGYLASNRNAQVLAETAWLEEWFGGPTWS